MKDNLYYAGIGSCENGECKRCPFWDLISSLPKQSNGFCHYMKRIDFARDSFGLLWDSCKECGLPD